MADWQLWLPPALSKPRFRLYVAGHSVSVIGGWIQQVAIAWLVFRLTNSAVLLGLAGFLLNIFYLLLGPLAGLAADRLRARTIFGSAQGMMRLGRNGPLPARPHPRRWGPRATQNDV